MIKRKTVPLFWTTLDAYSGKREIKNYNVFKQLIQDDGYEIERVDKIDDDTTMYILKKEVNDD